ncbi:hypothetical protein [Paractinoplanes hotanensis]|uniref:Uncharacterized protein n=1 Tax=Paractinoplanes hotanensis TaxID=2906497 RepID=A0ABT0XVV6_9ACTN|nr:hypothetical protein [Actinoplanes hotanensis]MCM4077920.1 hypothetical protein [Actinoplanes hotanensis]
MPARDFVAELPGLAAAVTRGAVDVRDRDVPLAEIAQAWTTDTDERIVLVRGPAGRALTVHWFSSRSGQPLS